MRRNENTIDIRDLSGGINDLHPAAINANQVVAAWDIEWWKSRLGGRRNGCTSLWTVANARGLFRHTPNSDPANDLLFLVDSAGTWKTRTVGGGVSTLTPSAADSFDPTTGVDCVSFHGKLFIACKNARNRLHVYDTQGNLRRAGINAPTATGGVADTAGAGTYAGTRYFRVRFTQQISGVTVLRSEPSAVSTFTPAGTKDGAIVNRPAPAGENETHWEVEESTNNADFYRIATVAMATASYTDNTVFINLSSAGVLSENVTAYALLPSARWLTTDNDRLVMGGNFEDATLDARVAWTQISGETGVGNDERLPGTAANYVDCDGRNNGGLTGLKAYEGKIVAFKVNQIHTLIRAGAGSAYVPLTVNRTFGAIPYSVCQGYDAANSSALFFLDPSLGPCVYGSRGVQALAPQLLRTWQSSINKAATVRVSHAVYYPDKRQVWWHVSTTGNNQPNVRWVYDTLTGGVAFHTLPATTFASAYWGNTPVMATAAAVLQCDVAGQLTDNGTLFRAYFRTRAYDPRGNVADVGGIKWGVLEADAASGVNISVTIIPNFGADNSTTVVADLTPVASETAVERKMDDAFLSDVRVVQFEIGDAAPTGVTAWQIHRALFVARDEAD